jgi:hypothetical protein
MVSPDKSTTYGRYGANGDFSTSQLDVFYQYSDSHSLDLRGILDALVDEGIRDVYLPNDTHWSQHTQRVVGVEMLGFLQQLGLVGGI